MENNNPENIYICQYVIKDKDNKDLISDYDIIPASELKKLFIDMFNDVLINNKPINFKYNKFYVLNLKKLNKGKYELIEKKFIDVINNFQHFYNQFNHFLEI